MKDRHATRNAVLAFLSMSEGRRPAKAIVAYMYDYHHVTRHTTYQMLWMLTREGLITKPRRGYYALGAPVEALNTTPPALTQASVQAGATMDSTRSTGENQDTGHRKELSDATTRMADALASGDPGAIRAAMGDHATALNSQATAMAASIAAPVYGQLTHITDQVRQLAEIVTNARQADLNWRTEERMQRDKQSDRLYTELDKLIAASEENGARLGKLEQGQIDYNGRLDAMDARHGGQWEEVMTLYRDLKAQIETDAQRLDRKRKELDDLNAWREQMKAWQADIDAWRAQTRLDDHGSA